MRGVSPELVKVATATAGTGTMTLGAAVSAAFMGVTQLVDGKEYVYTIVDGNDKEVGTGVYTASGTTFTRATVERSKIGGSEGTTKITLSGSATVEFGPSGKDHSSFINLTYGGIIGLHPVWTDATHIGCSPGAAYIESLGRAIFAAPADIAPSLANNTWYHVYLKSDGTLEAPTTAPAAFATPIGTARSKTSDTTRRYLYSFRTNGSAQIRQFAYSACNGVFRFIGVGDDFAVLTAGTATTPTALDCSAFTPVTARETLVELLSLSTTGYGRLASSEQVATLSATIFDAYISPSCSYESLLRVDASQSMQYMFSGTAGGGLYVSGHGYGLLR